MGLSKRGRKAYDSSKETINEVSKDMKDKAEDFFDFAEDKAKDAREKGKEYTDKAGDYLKRKKEEAIDRAEDLFGDEEDEYVPSQDNPKSKSGDDPLDFSRLEDTPRSGQTERNDESAGEEKASDRILNSTARLGDQLLDKSGKALNKFGDLSEKVGKRILDKGGDLWEKAQQAGEDFVE